MAADDLRCFTKRALESPDPTATHPIHSAEPASNLVPTRQGDALRQRGDGSV
jgi:hypothetical protein